MSLTFDSIPEAIRHKLRHGLTQTEYAKRCDVDPNLVSLYLLGRIKPTDKMLKRLGIVPHVKYGVMSERVRKGGQPRITRKRASQPVALAAIEPIENDKQSRPNHIPIEPRNVTATLGANEVAIALRYKVNPGRTWQAFQADSNGMDWESYCASNGVAPSQSEPVIAAPRQLYDHLKYIEPRPDHRRKLALGEKPNLAPIYQPKAISE